MRSTAQTIALTVPLAPTPNLLQQSQHLYNTGQYSDAIALLQRAIREYTESGDWLNQALTLSNLSLTYQQLGNWQAAEQAIAQSLALLRDPSRSAPSASEMNRIQLVLAQTLDILGKLQFSQGQIEAALATWQETTAAYEHSADQSGKHQSLVNQAEALQALGLYRQSIALLTSLTEALQAQPANLTQAVALRSLGDALLATGSLLQSRQALEQGLQVAKNLQRSETIASITLSLGNLTQAEAIAELSLSDLTSAEAVSLLNGSSTQANLEPSQLIQFRRRTRAAQAFFQTAQTALALYQEVIQSKVIETQVKAQLNQLNLQIILKQQNEVQILYPQILEQFKTLTWNRNCIHNAINLSQSLIKLSLLVFHPNEPLLQAHQLLFRAKQESEQLNDRRTQSLALGTLGHLYEQVHQWSEAEAFTQQALSISEQIDAADISYQWQWQIGRLLMQKSNKVGAIAAYGEAVQIIQRLRTDLVAVNRDVQFSFREQVEPLYREFVALLLEPSSSLSSSLENLVQARQVIEGLQVAELDNFFREACLEAEFKLDQVVDQGNLSAAILYPIVLPDRIEVILKLPQQALRKYTTTISQTEVERVVGLLQADLKKPFNSPVLKSSTQQLYDWLIRPAAIMLAENKIETLVFVLDTPLQGIPMSILHDGQGYLVEQYSIALAPGLQLPNPHPIDKRRFKVLVAGLSEARNNFPPLNAVKQEIEQVRNTVPSTVLLNQEFTEHNFIDRLSTSPFSGIHIATHGQFSSNLNETFILAWDHPIKINELSRLLQAQTIENPDPIELLVLSACQTAEGDRRATLGLAGIAIRAGARSTIASLWNVDDEAGAQLIGQFYQEWMNHPISKAEALRRAQRSLLANPQYESPRFWSPYVLLGNWL